MKIKAFMGSGRHILRLFFNLKKIMQMQIYYKISTYMSKLVAIEVCRISQEKANIKDSKLSIIQAIAYNEPSALVLINRLYYVGVTGAKNELWIFEFDEGLTFINELLGIENKKSTKLNNIYAGTNVSSSENR